MSDFEVVDPAALAEINPTSLSSSAGRVDKYGRLLVSLGGAPAGGSTAAPVAVRSANYTPKGYQQIVSPAASTPLTVPTGATVAIIQNNGAQPARWRDDGTAPTTTLGQRIAAGDTLTYDGTLTAFRVIQEAAGVTLDVLYYA